MFKHIRSCLFSQRIFPNFNRLISIMTPSFATFKINEQIASKEQHQQLSLSNYDDNEKLKQYLAQNKVKSILMYPYCYIPFAVIQAYSQSQEDKEYTKDIIAFRCLSNTNPQYLKRTYEILKPSEANLKKIKSSQFDVGRQMFTQYFNSKKEAFKKAFSPEGSLDQKIKYLIVLNNYKLNNSTTELVKQINEKQLYEWDKNGLGLAYYIQLLIKNNLSFKHIISKLSSKLADSSIDKTQKLKIALALLSLPRFYKSFSKQFIDSIAIIIREGISRMSNYELLQMLRFIYQYTSKQSITLCKRLLQHISNIDPSAHPQRVDFLIPLILKTFKYATILKIDISPSLNQLLNKSKEYNPMFQKISKIYFHTLLFLWQSQKTNEEIIIKLKSHLMQGVKYYSQTSNVIEDHEIQKLFSLVLKYWKDLSSQEKAGLKEYLVAILGSLTSQKSIIYECLLIILQENDHIVEKHQSLIERYTKSYLQSTCVRNNIGLLQVKSNIHQNIFLANLITKNKFIFIQSLPQVENYNFDDTEIISLQTLDKLIEYLCLSDNLKFYQINDIIARLQHIIIHYFNKKRMSFRTTLFIIELCSKGNYQRKYIYDRIEKSIYQILNKFPNFVIKKSDLHIIKDHMTKRNFGTKGFQDMINQTIERPNNWKEIKKSYVDHETQFWMNFDAKAQKIKAKQ